MRYAGGIAMAFLVLQMGCAAVPRSIPFDPDEYVPYEGEGTATLNGQAFKKTLGGEIKFGAGNTITLTPATAYAREWYNVVIVGRRRIAPGDPRETRFIRNTIGDGEGRFKFENLPAGEYFLTCKITWMVATGYQGSLEQTGGWVFALVSISDGEDRDIVLTG